MSNKPAQTPKLTWLERLRSWSTEIVILIAVFVVSLVVVGWFRAPDLPDTAPDFTLEALDGEMVTLSELQGRTVILNFWATWCAPCIAELPTLQAFSKARPDVTVIGVAIDDLEAVERRVELSGITYPVVIADQATAAAYKVDTYPTTVVVNADGSILTAHTGMALRVQLEWWRWWSGAW